MSINYFYNRLKEYGVFFVLVLIILLSAILSDSFMTSRNIINILGQASMIGIIALGQTFVILTAGIDLSVGSILTLSLIFIAGLIPAIGLFPALLVGIILGVLVGFFNGLGVTFGKLPPFIITLGMLSILRGVVFIYSGGSPIPILDERVFSFGIGTLFGIPYIVLLYLFLIIISAIILKVTPFGRSVYAIGSNEEAAHLSGVPVARYKIYVYMISGFLSAVAAIVFAARMGVGTPVAAGDLNLDSIAAVVVGGTSLMGGKGTIIGTVFGTLIIGILANIMNLTGVNPFIQRLLKGALIVGAVLIMQKSNKSKI